MIDMGKIHGIEIAKDAVMEAWHNASEELDRLTKKSSELTTDYVNTPYDEKRKLDELEELIRVNHTAWAVSYGMAQMCSQLCTIFEDMIDDEFKSETEAV